MTYLSAKKIFPGNWAEPLNGWYRNIDTNDSGSNDGSKGGPTSVLAVPGYRYFQQRGYVPVTATSGGGAVASGSVIVPSPYRNDDTRPDITGMVISGSSTCLLMCTAPPSPSLLAGVMAALPLVCMPPPVT
jgi:hypothetical protein